MRFCNTQFVSVERSDVAIVSKDGHRFEVKLAESEIARELNCLGAVSPRALQKNILVPFSTNTVEYLLGLNNVSDCTEEKSWFGLEKALEEIAGFGSQPNYPKILTIKNAICDHMLSTLSDRNCFLLHKKFRQFDCPIHANKTVEYILYNLVRMVTVDKIVDVEFFRLPVEELAELLNNDEINVDREVKIVEVIGKWIAADFVNRDKFRPMLMHTVRLMALDEETAKQLAEYRLSMQQPRKTRDILLAVGGWLHRQACDRIDWFDPEAREWKVSQQRLPMPLAYHGAAILGDELYVFGGSNGTRTRCETWKMSTKTWQWEKCDNMLEPRNYITNSSVVYDGKIYVFGGQNWREITRASLRSRTGEMYDPKTNKWTATGNLHDMRSDCAAAVFDNQIYVSGGFNGDNILASVEVYNPIGDFFSRYIDLPYPITGHCLVTHQERLFIVGGFNGMERMNKIWMCHRNGEWQEIPEKLVLGRSTSAAISYKGWLFSIAGYTERVEATCEIMLPTPDAARFGSIPPLPKAKSALKVLQASNWRSHLENRGIDTMDYTMSDSDSEYDGASNSFMSPSSANL
ncbi:hypothetical protein B9Z55_013658 [Caenorhabditis nigoni]|uniref:BACK domain-containing protein n=1 Tax=Caenorhabditis nigoni TaxID=1611254 RepID=A0A2G5U3K2_9PELO|nr:hypothetical protein B9Z55_013658 [Caenorhabditis nigoni]